MVSKLDGIEGLLPLDYLTPTDGVVDEELEKTRLAVEQISKETGLLRFFSDLGFTLSSDKVNAIVLGLTSIEASGSYIGSDNFTNGSTALHRLFAQYILIESFGQLNLSYNEYNLLKLASLLQDFGKFKLYLDEEIEGEKEIGLYNLRKIFNGEQKLEYLEKAYLLSFDEENTKLGKFLKQYFFISEFQGIFNEFIGDGELLFDKNFLINIYIKYIFPLYVMKYQELQIDGNNKNKGLLNFVQEKSDFMLIIYENVSSNEFLEKLELFPKNEELKNCIKINKALSDLQNKVFLKYVDISSMSKAEDIAFIVNELFYNLSIILEFSLENEYLKSYIIYISGNIHKVFEKLETVISSLNHSENQSFRLLKKQFESSFPKKSS